MKMNSLPSLLICLSFTLLICLSFALTACTGLTRDLSAFRSDENSNADVSSVPGEADVIPLDTVLFDVGDLSVTFGEFLFHYKIAVHAFFNSGQHTYYGVDAELPLDEQYFNEEAGVTWQKMFHGSVHDSIRRNLAMYQEAQAQGLQMGDLEKDYIKGFLEFVEKSSRDESITADEFVGLQYAEGLTLEMVTEYQQRYWWGVGYESRYRESHTFNDAELEAYFEQNKEEADLPDCTVVTLRNIFVYDKEEALEMLEKFDKEDKTEEVFIQYVKEYSDDETSKENGGLYEDYRPSNTRSNFTEMEAWLFDSERKSGDIKIHEWENGIEMVYFVSKGDPFWKFWSRDNMLESYFVRIMEKYPVAYPED